MAPAQEATPISYDCNALAFSLKFPLASGELAGPTKLTEIRRSSEVVYLMEMRELQPNPRWPTGRWGSVEDPVANYWPGYWDFWRLIDLPAPLRAVDRKRLCNHSPGEFNALFFDGHVESVRVADAS